MEPDLQQGPAQKAGDILVFLIRKETKCSECGQQLGSGRMISLDRDRGALCLVAPISIIWSFWLAAMLL